MQTELFELTLAFRDLSDSPDGDVEEVDLADEDLDEDEDEDLEEDAAAGAPDEDDDDEEDEAETVEE